MPLSFFHAFRLGGTRDADDDIAITETLAALEKINTAGALDSVVSFKKSSEYREYVDVEAGIPPPAPPSSPAPCPHVKRDKGKCLWSKWRGCISAYKFLFTAVILANIVILAELASEGVLVSEGALSAAAANLFAAVLIRQERVLNVFYRFFSRVSLRTPLFIRKHLADFHHYGGVHSGCATSSLAWYIGYIVLVTKGATGPQAETSVLQLVSIAICYLSLLLLVTICLTSLPQFRRAHHNIFEQTHRFGGWAAIAALWLHTILSTISSSATHHPTFYLLLLTTILLIIPWLQIRHLPCHAERLSPREVKITFPYENMPHTTTLRFSTSPLTEWHAFATIPSPLRCQASHIIVAESGDWTRQLIHSPPPKIYIRNPPTHNFLLSTSLFRRILLIGTGAGIGPILSLLLSLTPQQKQHNLIKVLWCANAPYAEHWQFAMRGIREVDPQPMIFDSKWGRPDLVLDARRLAREYAVEAVFVVSNRELTERIVGAVKGDGGAAFGAVFDS